MTHAPHEFLDTYVEGAIFQDGCAECETRAARFQLSHMDQGTWARARARALTLQLNGLDKASRCEVPVLRLIGEVLMKERAHIVVPEHQHSWIALRSIPPQWRCLCGEVTETRPA